ncbi:DNA topoisomerase 2-alpha-like [Oppia nitens]|uniref:DNA topoisomerase 2-alpha-like n=1 Tax=Oppia nitens TaxID=1686743 RepID=UPI0023DB180E|nr:DNA topoisomerase 2-alpha-like [Oppia nitens]
MSSDENSSDTDDSFETKIKPSAKTKKKKDCGKLSIERIYQKKTQLEHILLRPDTYIGSVEKETKQMWVFDEEQGMQLKEISYVPGIYKIFDEVLVNAADNKQRDKGMNCIRVDIDPEKNEITIFNNGKGIPVIEHKEEKMFVPTLIFGHLLTSSNYDDNEKKVVGGRNGYGAKLCNIFSTKFKVETSFKEYKKAFSQIWTDNMMNTKDPKITTSSGEDFTRITFSPDLSKFGMTQLDKDIVALFSRRAYDVAGSTKGVKVFLNGKRLPVMGFKDYVEQFIKDKEDDTGNPLKMAYEQVSDRWEIACTVSDKGLQQISFVNSIATTRGGKHIDYIADQIVHKMVDIIKKKNKAGINIKPFQIKNHLWIFVNCLIENPTFDSQTKETMTLQQKSFGSKCVPSDKFFNAVNKTGIVESVMTWVRFKAQTELSKQCHSKKQSKLKGIPKLEDANDAGTKHSIDCTLILTEGDSAKSLVVAGLGVIGRDKYGVFPLRGKMLNVREATHKQILENQEINNLIKILGLQYKKQYASIDDLKTLRYGKLMIMTDQDQDGSHIKGLLINFIHHNWPKLLELNFLEEFITPIVKVSKGSEVKSFYSLPEFEEWKKETSNWNNWKIKYYKGLGTSTANEAKEYFSDMIRHRIKFKYSGTDDDLAVKLAFSKKLVEQRKDWLTNSMEERKKRRELGLPEVYLYESNTRSVSYKDFVNKELILFSNMDNERSIPSLMDGLKPGQRKVLFTCFKRNDKREVKVAQLAGSVGEHSAYHHGEASLMSTIINLAQNFVGSNNINLLQPIGQFGTRLQGGKDAASPRYIFTMLSPLARKIFPALDDPLLNTLMDDNLKIEPEYYVPILPMVLVNGAEGIGTGWSTKIPNYNPREIVQNLRRMIRGESTETMQPWFKNFRGNIIQIDSQKYVINGEVGILNDKSFEITELPVRVWTQTYKESTLEVLLHGTEKTPSFINEYKEYHTESTVKFIVNLLEANLKKSLDTGIHKTFKLQSTLSTTSMVLFDHNGCLKRYDSPEEIIEEYFPVRLEFYAKRKAYYEGKLEAEALKLENMAKFILEKNDGTIRLENIKKKDFIRQLIDKRYDSDPVKSWEKKYKDGDDAEPSDDENDYFSYDDRNDDTLKKYNYDYLFDMKMSSMLRENIERLLKERDTKKQELEDLKRMTAEMLWEKDLTDFLEELDRVEDNERQVSSKPIKSAKSGTNKSRGGTTKSTSRLSYEAKPSDFAERIEPKIDFEIYKKSDKAIKKAIEKKKTNNEKDSESDDDLGRSLSERIGVSPQIIDEKRGKSKTIKSSLITDLSEDLNNEKPIKKKQTKKSEKNEKSETNKKKKKGEDKKKKKKSPWSDSESDDEQDYDFHEDSDDEDKSEYIPSNTSTRIVSKPKTITEDINKEDFVSLNSISDQKKEELKNTIIKKSAFVDSDDDLFSTSTTKTVSNKRTSEELFDSLFTKNDKLNDNQNGIKESKNGINNNHIDSDDSYERENDKKQELETIFENKPTKASKKAFDSDSDKEFELDLETKPKLKATKASKKAYDSDNDSSKSKPKNNKKASKSKKKKKTTDTEESEEEKPKKKKSKKGVEMIDGFEIPPELREKSGRVRQPVKYNFGDDSDD